MAYLNSPSKKRGPLYGNWDRRMICSEAAQAYTATLSLIPSFGALTRSCFVPRYRSVV